MAQKSLLARAKACWWEGLILMARQFDYDLVQLMLRDLQSVALKGTHLWKETRYHAMLVLMILWVV